MSHTAARSWKLTAAVISLAILPLLLPFPFALIELKWIAPVVQAQWPHCGADCPPAIYWLRLGWLLVLGPSLLVALASLLLGTFGLIRARWRATSPKNRALLQASVTCGALWILLLGCMYWVIFEITGLVP